MKTIFWEIDTVHSEVHFKVRHLLISTVTGAFRIFHGRMKSFDNENFENSEFDFTIDTYSVDTNETDRDEHLKSAEFFDADANPEIRFESTSFHHKSGDHYELKGNLTLKGTTKEVTLKALFGGEAKDGFGKYRAGFEISGTINRKEFGVTYSALTEAGGLVIGDEVTLTANVQFVKMD